MKAKSKTVGIIGCALIVLFIALAIVADVLCTTFAPYISLFFRDRTASTEEVIAAANKFTEEQEAGGLVLMKNENNALPLDSSVKKINLFGALSVKELYLGTGSAGGWNWDPTKFVNLKTAFSDEGIEVNPNLWKFYSDLTGDAGKAAGAISDMQGSTHDIVDVALDYTGYADVRNSAKTYSDTAFIVVGRAGAEGNDQPMDMTPGESKQRGGATGYSYLELMPQERALIEEVKKDYKNVILLVNTPMPIEMEFVDGAAGTDGKGNIDAVLWIGMPGSTGNRAVVKALKGEISPSGRTTDTWAYEVESAPSYYNFGDYAYDNVIDVTKTGLFSSKEMNLRYVHYQEGIYVGYRWYETANAEGAKVENVGNYFDYKGIADGKGGSTKKSFDFSNYESVVQYPFGYGLSYTDFKLEFASAPKYEAATNQIVFKVKVTNTGSVASKTPVEVYVESPFDVTRNIEKSKVVLTAFEKTEEIAAGKSATVEFKINRDELASYDYINSKSYVLTAGNYKFYVDYGKYGSHCWAKTSDKDAVLEWTYALDSEIVFNGDNKRDGDLVTAVNQFDSSNVGDGSYTPSENDLKRANIAETFPKSYEAATKMNIADENTARRLKDKVKGAVLEGYNAQTYKYEGEFGDENGEYKDPTTGYTALPTGQEKQLICEDLINIPYNDKKWDTLISQLSMSDLEKLVTQCEFSNPAIKSIGKNAAVDMDGAEGLHDLISGVDANCYTCTTVMASSFDKDLAYRMGVIYGDECVANGVSAMYGFSANTHRSPFGGRSFEYYSEDGVLAGVISAAQTSGLQSKGISVYTKHVVLNEQETNRYNVHTWASEQAIREIYLRPYEIVCKTATYGYSDLIHGSSGIMTAMNSIGTSSSSAHYPLLNNVFREEWGFNGRMITDAGGWDVTSASVRAGISMFFGSKLETDLDGVDNTSGYGLAALQTAAKRQLFVFVNSTGVAAGFTSNGWIAIPIAFTVVMALGAIVVAMFMVIPAFFIKKQ